MEEENGWLERRPCFTVEDVNAIGEGKVFGSC